MLNRQNVIQAKCYLGEMLYRRNVIQAKCYIGESVLGKMLYRRKGTRRKCTRRNVTRRNVTEPRERVRWFQLLARLIPAPRSGLSHRRASKGPCARRLLYRDIHEYIYTSTYTKSICTYVHINTYIYRYGILSFIQLFMFHIFIKIHSFRDI